MVVGYRHSGNVARDFVPRCSDIELHANLLAKRCRCDRHHGIAAQLVDSGGNFDCVKSIETRRVGLQITDRNVCATGHGTKRKETTIQQFVALS